MPRATEPRRPRDVVGAALAALRQIVGAPDYERYLQHHAAHHPDRPPLTAREYYDEFVTRRCAGGGTGCC